MSTAYSPIHRIITIKITKEKTSSFQVIIGSVLLLPRVGSPGRLSESDGEPSLGYAMTEHSQGGLSVARSRTEEPSKFCRIGARRGPRPSPHPDEARFTAPKRGGGPYFHLATEERVVSRWC